MDPTTLLTIGASAVGVVLTVANTWLLYTLRSFSSDVERLRTADQVLAQKIGALELLVAGQYITRVEFQQTIQQQTNTILGSISNVVRQLTGGGATK